MQKPIRYYITKSGDEPTVRSVRVALGEAEPRVESETVAPGSDATSVKPPVAAASTEVKRRVKAVIRRPVDGENV